MARLKAGVVILTVHRDQDGPYVVIRPTDPSEVRALAEYVKHTLAERLVRCA